jgi:ephrin-B
VDNDENNNGLGVINQWKKIGGLFCAEETHVCGRESGPQENWMITQHISTNVSTILVMIDSNLDIPCPSFTPSCVDDLSLYVWETSMQTTTLALETDNYRFIANVSSGEQVVTVQLSSGSGFYLGMRDNGTCVSVRRVLVYYSVCGGGREGLARVEETVFSSGRGSTVQGVCVPGSKPSSQPGPLLECLQTGQWRPAGDCQPQDTECNVPQPCQCRPRFHEEVMANGELTCSACSVGMYSEGRQQRCMTCPVNSNSSAPGMAECPCARGYYRPAHQGPSAPCIQPCTYLYTHILWQYGNTICI